MKVIKLSDDYFNEMSELFKNKYIISDATHSNQYLDIKFINNKKIIYY